MSHTFEDLARKKVAELRTIAKDLEHDALQGFAQMQRSDLMKSLCAALGIEARADHPAVKLDRRAIKQQIAELRSQRDAALEAHDAVALKRTRRKMHRLKRKLRA